VKTIKKKIIEVLTESERWLTSEEIIAQIQDRFGDVVVRTSLSPQLSRLKNDDKIISYNELNKSWGLDEATPDDTHPLATTESRELPDFQFPPNEIATK